MKPIADDLRLDRRAVLGVLGLTAAGGALVTREAFAQGAGAGAQGAARLLPGAGVCVLTPETTEGPFYLDPALERSDITEGRPGVPLTLRLQIVDRTCAPLLGARADIWHCDALGDYSAFEGGRAGGSRTTYLRGHQYADGNGVVSFRTIYPGWYPGRTTHIHFKVLIDASSVLTGQIFFPDSLSSSIYADVAPYSGRGARRDTLNSNDFIAEAAGRAAQASVRQEGTRLEATMIVGVDPAA